MARASREAVPGVSPAHDRFTAAPVGDDANPGTPEKPFKTIARAQKAVRDSEDQTVI